MKILIYCPRGSLGVRKSTELLALILQKEAGFRPIELCYTLGEFFIRRILNPKSVSILSLYSIFFSIFFANSFIFVHGYPENEHYSKFRQFLILFAYKLGFFFSSGVIFVSEVTRKRFAEIGTASSYILHNNLDAFCNNKILGVNKLIYWGRVIPAKGLSEICEIYRQMKSIDPNWSLDIWGEGKETFISSLLSDGINYKGNYNSVSQLKSFYGSLRGQVFISLNSKEPFGITYIEAAREGCLVVIPKNAGAREILSGSGIFEYDVNLIDRLAKISSFVYKVEVSIKDDRKKLTQELMSLLKQNEFG
jgi:glycosyltransferase involved in cell wall biosynthesis